MSPRQYVANCKNYWVKKRLTYISLWEFTIPNRRKQEQLHRIMAKAGDLLASPPVIEKVDVLAAKFPIAT